MNEALRTIVEFAIRIAILVILVLIAIWLYYKVV